MLGQAHLYPYYDFLAKIGHDVDRKKCPNLLIKAKNHHCQLFLVNTSQI